MALQFILGNSGSGKSEHIYRKITEEASRNITKNYLVIVPEQFTMQTQKKLVELSKNKAIMNIDVLSFQRLAYRVFDELGIKNVKVLEETGKNLVLRKVAQGIEDKLTVLRPNISRMGYIGEIKSLLSELMQYNISPEQLRAYINSGKLSPVLAAKLSDVLVMYEGFNDFMKDKYITAEELLNVLKGVAGDSEILRDSVIVFDEFTGFTPVQNELMSELLKICEQIYVTLTIDSREEGAFYNCAGMHELFYMPKKTIRSLMKMAGDLHVDVAEPVVLQGKKDYRFKESEEMFFLEQNLFRKNGKKYSQEVSDITLTSCKNPKEELVYTARMINDYVQNKGMRYKEIAIVTGDVESCSNYVERIFTQYNIPFFLDTTKDILFHPFIEFVRAALEIIEKDFSYEAVFRFLRCGFCDIEDEKIDTLENYILAAGIRGRSAWSKRWLRSTRNKNEYDLEEMNSLRETIYQLLEPLVMVFKDKDSDVRGKIIALYELFVRLDVEKKLAEKENELLKLGEQVKSKEYGQIYEIVMSLFEKYVSILGEEKIGIREFTEILDAGFDAASVAAIPPGYDNVMVGDIERTRLNGVKVLFFLGVNDGIVPKSVTKGGIISQYEREALREMDVELAPGARELTFIQRYYLYLNMTKPSNKLHISYSRLDATGKTILPSYLVGVIKRMYEKLSENTILEVSEQLDISTERAARNYLLCNEPDEDWYRIARYFYDKDRDELERLIQAKYASFSNNPISSNVARAVYGNHIEGSVTRIEQYARCAYAYYLKYGLRLREREIKGFENVDIGNIYHEALKHYSLKLENSESDWFSVSDEIRDELAETAIEEAFEPYVFADDSVTGETKHMMERMKGIFLETIWALTNQVRRGSFVPKEFEVSFSDISETDKLHFDFGDKRSIDLGGRIDRVDTCLDADKMYVKVVDYKSGGTQFDLVKIYEGTQLQLVVYLNAAIEKNKLAHPDMKIAPAGILYYHIDDPTIEVSDNLTEKEIDDIILKKLRPDGVVGSEEKIYRAMDKDFESESLAIPVQINKNGSLSARSSVLSQEEFEVVRDFAATKIKELGQDMFDGRIDVNTDSCKYCAYESICGVRAKLPGLSDKSRLKIDKNDVLDKMIEANAMNKLTGEE